MATPLGGGGMSIYSGARALSLAKEGLRLEPCGLIHEPCDLEPWFLNHVP